MYDNCYNIDIKLTGFYKSYLLLIHGRLGKFTDTIDPSEAMAGYNTQRTFLLGPYSNCWKKPKEWYLISFSFA